MKDAGRSGITKPTRPLIDFYWEDYRMAKRPRLGIVNPDTEAAVHAFAEGLQAGLDRHSAGILNRQFAADVVWGSPYGALVNGYDQLHPIHVRFQERPTAGAAHRYSVEHILAVSEDVVIAHIAKIAMSSDDVPLRPGFDSNEPYSEMAMYVFVRRDGEWWLAAGQNTPMRPGGAVPAQIFAERSFSGC